MISRFRIAFPALLLLAAPAFAADDIKPEAILDKYVEVTGGRAAYEKIKTEVATGTLEITSIGLSGTLTIRSDDIKPEAILDKYVEVTGGRAAYEKIKTEVATGTLEITSIGLSGTLTIRSEEHTSEL